MANKLSNEEFVYRLKKCNPNLVALDEYINSSTYIRFRCNECSDSFIARPANLLHGGGCRKCGIEKSSKSRILKAEDAKKRILQKNGNLILLSEYTRSDEEMKCKCKVCGNEWSSRAIYLLQGHGGCKKCSKLYTYTREELVEEINRLNSEISLISEYINMTEAIRVKCGICGYEWDTIPSSIKYLQRIRCKKCEGHYDYNTNDFKRWVKNNCSELEVVGEYINASTPIEMKCLKCGDVFNTRPQHIFAGSRCKSCSYKRITEERIKRAAQKFEKEMQKKEGCLSKRVVSDECGYEFLEEYKGSQIAIDCQCRRCGHVWKVQPISIQQGHGCPKCSKSSTSYMEQFIYHSLCHVFGKKEVISRDRKVIGNELDIYLPNKKYAIEIGSWEWHKKIYKKDEQKIKKCEDKGIRLRIIYDSYKKKDRPFDGAEVYSFDLASEMGLVTLKAIINSVLKDLKVSTVISDMEYEKIGRLAEDSSKKTTTAQLVDIVKKVNSDIEILGEYTSNNNPIKVKCLVCGNIWNSRPADLKNGRGCRICANKKNGLRHRNSSQEYSLWIEKNRPNLELLSEYTTSHELIKYRCKKCNNVYERKAYFLKSSNGCITCSGTKKLTHEEFLFWLSINRPDFEIVDGKYENNKSKMIIRCKNCGCERSASANMIKRGKGCPKCQSNKH